MIFALREKRGGGLVVEGARLVKEGRGRSGFTDISDDAHVRTVANVAFLIFLEYAVNKAPRRGIRCSSRRNEEIEVARALDPATEIRPEKRLGENSSPAFPSVLPRPKLKYHRERY